MDYQYLNELIERVVVFDYQFEEHMIEREDPRYERPVMFTGGLAASLVGDVTLYVNLEEEGQDMFSLCQTSYEIYETMGGGFVCVVVKDGGDDDGVIFRDVTYCANEDEVVWALGLGEEARALYENLGISYAEEVA